VVLIPLDSNNSIIIAYIMSDFDHDIDDELLALAGDSEGRRKKSKQSSSRKRKR
jgi:hypothetical protein